jgi:hypothetical protein
MSAAHLSQQVPTSHVLPAPASQGGARPDSAQIESSYNEQITEMVGRLQRRYPAQQFTRADLERRVRDAYHQFDTARIRSFVGVFVERLVRRSLEQPPAPAASGAVG